MAVLSDSDRREQWAIFMRENKEALSLTKSELRDAVNATDLWIDNNQASFNTAIPLPARTALSTRQKVLLFMFMASKRFDIL
jgi:hypothetical protein